MAWRVLAVVTWVVAGLPPSAIAQFRPGHPDPMPAGDSFSAWAATPDLAPSALSSSPIERRLQELFSSPAAEEQRLRPGPNVPEPMVFDLIRPLGARRGELEVNVLGFVPFRRTVGRTPQFNFITGADQSKQKRPTFEWAPEIEYALIDNFALEFELPMADGRVEAFKGAAQYTLGTAFQEQFIHGFQGILFIDRTNGAVTPTLLYLAALRLDPVYTLQGMVGFSHEFGGDNPRNPTQVLFNGCLFAELNRQWTVGVEVNYAAELDGAAALLVVPQAHWNPRENISVQFGVGARALEGSLIGELIFRLVREF